MIKGETGMFFITEDMVTKKACFCVYFVVVVLFVCTFFVLFVCTFFVLLLLLLLLLLLVIVLWLIYSADVRGNEWLILDISLLINDEDQTRGNMLKVWFPFGITRTLCTRMGLNEDERPFDMFTIRSSERLKSTH